MSWTDERVETLKKLWTDGLSASQIAAELGGITRNAVIGKVHRLGMSASATPPGQGGTWLELPEEPCRWPIGDPGSADFFFCGGQSITSLPYCAYHSRVAYQPANVRRDRRSFRG